MSHTIEQSDRILTRVYTCLNKFITAVCTPTSHHYTLVPFLMPLPTHRSQCWQLPKVYFVFQTSPHCHRHR